MAGVRRARVFFDIAPFGEHPGGRLVFELYTDIVPTTAQNFRQLCTGEHGVGKSGKPLTYKGASSLMEVVGCCPAGVYCRTHNTLLHALERACMVVCREHLPSHHPRLHGAGYVAGPFATDPVQWPSSACQSSIQWINVDKLQVVTSLITPALAVRAYTAPNSPTRTSQ